MNTNYEIEKVEFYDKKKWKEKIESFKERFFQCEISFVNGKKFLMNANENGINYFIKQLKDLNLKNINTYETFLIDQDIDEKRIRQAIGPAKKLSSLEIDSDDCCVDFNGYGYASGMHAVLFRDKKGKPAQRLEVCWYPENKRILGSSINYQEWAIKIHLSPEGLDDLIQILSMYNNVYCNFKIFYPSDVFIQKYGYSCYSLTDIPNLSAEEEHVLFVEFRKELETENQLFFRGPKDFIIHKFDQELKNNADEVEKKRQTGNKIFFEEGVGGVVLKSRNDLKAFLLEKPSPEETEKKRASIRFGNQEYNLIELCASPMGLLELKAILKSCVEQFQEQAHMDFSLNKIDNSFLDKIYPLSGKDPINNKIQYYDKIRFVFLREPEVYVLSIEYDPNCDILYIYITLPQILHLLTQVLIALGGRNFKYSCIGWHEQKKIKPKSTKITTHLSDIKFGNSSFYKFDIFELQCSQFDSAVLINRKLNRMYLSQPTEENCFCKILTFNGYKIFNAPYTYIY